MLMGVNLAGAEFGQNIPGVYGKDYIFPTTAELDYYNSKGLTLIRLPFLWERMQPSPGGALDQSYLNMTKEFVAAAAERGMEVVLDAHNYGRYYNNTIGSAAVPYASFKNFWTKMATEFNGKAGVYGYDIMNEPHDMGGPNVWPTAAQAAVDGIRSVDKATKIIVEGDQWAGAQNWLNVNENLVINDPSNKIIYQAHLYFDRNASGTYAGTYDQEGAYPMIGVDRLQPFISWLDKHNAQGYVGEYGVQDNDPRWLTVLDNFQAELVKENISGTYFAGGPWWGDTSMAVDPSNGQDRPQMSILAKYPSVVEDTDAGTDSGTDSGVGKDTIVVHASEDAYLGDAVFKLLVDGYQIGADTTVTANHRAGQWQDFTFHTDLATTAKSVSVVFTNDAYGGTAATDRNLYVQSITIDGKTQSPSKTALLSTGDAATVSVSTNPDVSVPTIPELKAPPVSATPVHNHWGKKGLATLTGDAAADRLDGLNLTHNLRGGTGDTTFVVRSKADKVSEPVNGGIDTVEYRATKPYVLPDNVENLILKGKSPHVAQGNAGLNMITLSDADDRVTAGSGGSWIVLGKGASEIFAGAGRDVFVFKDLAAHDVKIHDFDVTKDVLDLRPAFSTGGYSGTDPIADHTLTLASDGNGGTNVSVSLVGQPAHVMAHLDHVTPGQIAVGTDLIWH